MGSKILSKNEDKIKNLFETGSFSTKNLLKMTIKKIIQLINDQKLLAFYDFLLIELDSIKEENKLKQKFEEYFKFYETKRNNLTPTNTDLDHKNNKAYKHPNETYVDHDKIHENHSQTKDNRETYENMVTKKKQYNK